VRSLVLLDVVLITANWCCRQYAGLAIAGTLLRSCAPVSGLLWGAALALGAESPTPPTARLPAGHRHVQSSRALQTTRTAEYDATFPPQGIRLDVHRHVTRGQFVIGAFNEYSHFNSAAPARADGRRMPYQKLGQLLCSDDPPAFGRPSSTSSLRSRGRIAWFN
jgi:hypothetical protein